MRTSYIFYKTATGKIEMQRNLLTTSNEYCNPTGVACMQGYVLDINANKVDVSQDPISKQHRQRVYKTQSKL